MLRMPHNAFLTLHPNQNTHKDINTRHINGIYTNFKHSENTNIPNSKLTIFNHKHRDIAKSTKSQRMHTDRAHQRRKTKQLMQNRKLDRFHTPVAEFVKIGQTNPIFTNSEGVGRGIGRQKGRGSQDGRYGGTGNWGVPN